MDSFREYVASPRPGQPGVNINPVSMKKVDDYMKRNLLPGMSPQEKSKVDLIYNPSSQLINDFWQTMAQNNYNVNQILPTLRQLQNDPRLPKISGFVSPQQGMNQTPTTPVSR